MKKSLSFAGIGVLLLALALAVTPAVAATTIVVTPTSLDGWAEDSTPPADVNFVAGPGTPPLGAGSAQFSVDASGATDAELRNHDYAGTLLSDLTELSYATYVQNNNNEQAVYIILNVDYDNDGSGDDLLFFEPVYQDASFCSSAQGDVVLNTWQTWDALTGCWWSVNGTAGATPGTGVKTLATIIAAEPDATIVNGATSPPATKGGVRLVAGFGGPADWGNFLGNADAFAIGVSGDTTTYDFELITPTPTPTPTPIIGPPTNKDQCKNGGWQTFNNPAFKNQGDCVSFVASQGKAKGNP